MSAAICTTYVNEMFGLYLNFYRMTYSSASATGGYPGSKADRLAAKRAIDQYVESNDVEKVDCIAASKAAMAALGIRGADVPGLDRIGKKPGSIYPGRTAHLRARAEEQDRPYRPFGNSRSRSR